MPKSSRSAVSEKHLRPELSQGNGYLYEKPGLPRTLAPVVHSKIVHLYFEQILIARGNADA